MDADANRLRARAEQARRLADGIYTAAERARMIKIAEDCELEAEKAERAEGGGPEKA